MKALIKRLFGTGLIIIAIGAASPGCKLLDIAKEKWGGSEQPIPDPNGEVEQPDPDPNGEIPEGTVWLDFNVSGWPVTTSLNAHVSGNTLVLANSKERTWPKGLEARGGGDINANAWVFVDVNGTWYAATWEWLRTGQHSKRLDWVKGTDGHIHRAPLSTWVPRSGETYGFMVSTPARCPIRTVNERSNVSWMVWP